MGSCRYPFLWGVSDRADEDQTKGEAVGGVCMIFV